MSWDDDDLLEPKQKTRRSIVSIGSTAFTGLKNRLKYTGKKIVSNVHRTLKDDKTVNARRLKAIKPTKAMKAPAKAIRRLKHIRKLQRKTVKAAEADLMPTKQSTVDGKNVLLTAIFEHPTMTRGQKDLANKLLTMRPVKVPLKRLAEVTGFKPRTIISDCPS